MAQDTTQNKKQKAKGPIRWEAIVPFTIFVLLVWAYFFFFFDSHLRRGMEFAGTHINGAEVNIADVKTSFWNASLEIRKIQITDLDEPTKNKLQIGRVHWKMLWDALLRGKIAIEDASILEIALGAPRDRPGRVLPPKPPEDKSTTEKIRDQALEKVQEEFSQNVLGDIASILGGVDPKDQLKNIEGQLKSAVRVAELESELKKKEEQWRNRIANLPQAKDIEALQQRLKTVKLDGFNNPAEAQKSLQDLDAIFKELDAKYKDVQSTGQALNSDVGTYQNALKELEAMVQQDIKDLESRLKIPKLDATSLTKSILGPMFLDKVQQTSFYMDKAREYMPPKKTAEEKAQYQPPTPREREVGRNYKFGTPNSYPLFWLKNAEISSKAVSGADWSGNLSGVLRDVTDDPVVLGRPTVAAFKGEFPAQGLFGIDGALTIDHTTENPVESLALKVGSFPVAGRELVKSDNVMLGFGNAQGSIQFDAELRGQELKINSNSNFTKPASKAEPGSDASSAGSQAPSPAATASSGSFLVAQAQQPILNDILTGALADIPKVTLNASLAGSWSNLRINLNSNLGQELASAFDKQIQAKINEARAQLTAMVDERVGKEKEKLTAEFNKVKAQLDGVLKEKEAEINKAKNQIETAKNEAIKGQSKKLENEGKKALEDLKKKFKF